ncbi:MAG: SPOR domain-containing protein [Gammaproteobacteria bacterium]|nr:SPOR domain-containing protein [Gammaproteobacteria bacterium]
MMKKIREEHIKHRLIGLTVALSLMIIFLPAMMKHSNRRFDELSTTRMPEKPALPNVDMVAKETMFKEVKVATVSLPEPAHVTSDIAKAQSLSAAPSQIVSRPLRGGPKRAGRKEFFTVQLATFSQKANAQALVKDLRSRGFQASSQEVPHDQGQLYQVIVGQLKQRDQAIDLQKKLINNTQLNGLIIKTKVT